MSCKEQGDGICKYGSQWCIISFNGYYFFDKEVNLIIKSEYGQLLAFYANENRVA